jgi:AcrR family transcriptional regulator
MSSRRNYRSTLREDRAGETRAKILEGARTLFADRGFANTTINDVAAAAGVAAPTVYAVFGGKGGMLRALLVDMEMRADLPAFMERFDNQDDHRAQLRTFVSFLRTFYEQGAPVLRAALVTTSDADVAAMVAEGNNKRREATQRLAAVWHELEALREGLTRKQAAESLWMLTSVEQFLFATDRLAWTPAHYERWLRDLLERELFGN